MELVVEVKTKIVEMRMRVMAKEVERRMRVMARVAQKRMCHWQRSRRTEEGMSMRTLRLMKVK